MVYGRQMPKGLTGAMQSQYLSDPRLALAQELMKAGASTDPVSTPLAGFARMLQAGIGGYRASQIGNEYQQRGKAYSEALTQAWNDPRVQTGIPGINNAPGPNMDGSAGWSAPGTEPGYATMARLLSEGENAGNPDLQEYAQQLGLKDIESKQKLQDKMKELIMEQPFKLQAAAAGATRVNVGAQEKEEDKAVGKAFGEDYVAIQKSGRDAPGKIAKYERLNSLLAGIETGTFKGTTTELKAAAKGAGIDLEAMGIKDDVGPVQAATALTNAMALELRNPSGGAGMPGALSDSDRVYLQSMTPGIEKTKEGRALMTDTATKLAKRDAEIAQLARNYRAKNGRLDEGFYDVLSQYSTQNPLFGQSGAATPQVPNSRPPLSQFMK